MQNLDSSLKYICAVGFEPNPNHVQTLRGRFHMRRIWYIFLLLHNITISPLIDLVDAYDKCDWKIKIFTQTAVSNHEGTTYFYSDHREYNKEMGGTIFGE